MALRNPATVRVNLNRVTVKVSRLSKGMGSDRRNLATDRASHHSRDTAKVNHHSQATVSRQHRATGSNHLNRAMAAQRHHHTVPSRDRARQAAVRRALCSVTT